MILGQQNDLKQEFLVCQCTSLEHLVRFSWFPKDEDKCVYMEFVLNRPSSFLARFKLAWKYFFAFKTPTNTYDDLVLGPKQLRKLKQILDESSADLNITPQ